MKFEQKTIDKISARVQQRYGTEAESAHRIDNYTRAVCELMLPGDLPEEVVDNFRGIIDQPPPIPMLLWCPECGKRHVDRDFANKLHTTHACQHCGHVWKPAKVATVGVQFLPGYKDDPK